LDMDTNGTIMIRIGAVIAAINTLTDIKITEEGVEKTEAIITSIVANRIAKDVVSITECNVTKVDQLTTTI
jgi:hypothetical protein